MLMCECYTPNQPPPPPSPLGPVRQALLGLSGILKPELAILTCSCIVSPEHLLFHLAPDNIQAFYSFPVFQAGGNESRGCQGEAQEQ